MKVKPTARIVPAYENANAKLYIGDCRQLLKKVPAPGSVATIFVDPPYGIAVKYGDGSSEFNDDLSPVESQQFTREWITACCSRLRPGGAFFVHLPDHLAAYAYVHMAAMGLIPVNWIILHQAFGQYGESRFITSKVHLLYFVKPGGERTWNVEEVLQESRRSEMGDKRIATAKFKGMRPALDFWMGTDCWMGLNLGRIQGNNKERWNPHLHPNQVGETVLARVIRATTNPGDTVLDCCMGSGTTGVVANALKRRFVGMELLPKVAASGWKRILRGPVRDVAGPLFGGTDD